MLLPLLFAQFLFILPAINADVQQGPEGKSPISFPLIHRKAPQGSLKHFLEARKSAKLGGKGGKVGDRMTKLVGKEQKRGRKGNGKSQKKNPFEEEKREGGPSPLPLVDFFADMYLLNVSLGTPPQSFLLMPTTFGADVWVTDVDCLSDACVGSERTRVRQRFDTSQSSTFREHTDEETYSWYYDGDVGDDLLRVANLEPQRFRFGLAQTIYFSQFLPDGFFGIGWPSMVEVTGGKALIDVLGQGLEQKTITVWLKSRKQIHSPEVGGQITFGGSDPEHCDEEWSWQALYPPKMLDIWVVESTGFEVGNLKNHRKRPVVNVLEIPAIFGPPSFVAEIAKATNAKWDDENWFYTVPCDAKGLPDLKFKFGDKVFSVPPEEYLLEDDSLDKNTCVLGVMEDDGDGYGPAWYLGNPFTRTYCVQYDFANKRVGYARAKSGKMSSEGQR